ncbi:hypothetical protein BHU72_03980 [Desulfuribacillus stibiiarsenatis]|uniref:GH18 domain-containing protein n=1 Tax=Desulfuribacillus stibiiarsenatis TaxID=1390249 RepID=A0A1E5L5I3_9FIRM|nr:glycosyl hydrolase family 18 protein [Desulfuribacillus stibiiarsenatis]OEH85263.1 hypothetical protein BHU72_03980 [Desulfuribacillus stibiiarsenatis]
MNRQFKLITVLLIFALLFVTPLQTIDAKKGLVNNPKHKVSEPAPLPAPAPEPTPTPEPEPTPKPEPAPVEPPAPLPEPKTMLGYYTVYFNGDKGSYNAVNSFKSYINEVSMVTFKASATGTVLGSADTLGLQLMKENNIRAHATISNENNGQFDPEIASIILKDSTIRNRLIANIDSLVTTHSFKGVNIDFENMYPADRPLFTQFITELANQLNPKGFEVVVSVSAKTTDAPNSAWIGAFDYAALGKVATKIQLMTYDQHGPWGTPGPVASYPWMESVVQYAVSQIPSSKILLGLPAYGYDWNQTNNTGNKAIAWRNIPAFITTNNITPQWDSTAKTPFFTYTSSEGHKRIVWYDNPASIEVKAGLVGKYNLDGVAMWRLGLEDESFWQAAKAGVQ